MATDTAAIPTVQTSEFDQTATAASTMVIWSSASNDQEMIPEKYTGEGDNSSGNNGFDGLCTPSGIHRYFFKLSALDTVLNLESDVTNETLLAAMEGHILEGVKLMGKYQRTRH